eukprot:PhF_6_TR18688/c0_g1_i3/m.27317
MYHPMVPRGIRSQSMLVVPSLQINHSTNNSKYNVKPRASHAVREGYASVHRAVLQSEEKVQGQRAEYTKLEIQLSDHKAELQRMLLKNREASLLHRATMTNVCGECIAYAESAHLGRSCVLLLVPPAEENNILGIKSRCLCCNGPTATTSRTPLNSPPPSKIPASIILHQETKIAELTAKLNEIREELVGAETELKSARRAAEDNGPRSTSSSSSSSCLFCCSRERNVVFFPCRHMISCLECSEKVVPTDQGKCCPICRGVVLRKETIIMS